MAIGAEASFVARTIDSDRKHLTAVLAAAAAHRGTSLVEIYQNCPIFNDGAFDAIKDNDTKADAIIPLVHGEPITFGNGADYGVNVMRRYLEERPHADARGAAVAAIRETGGAVTLCSLTTIIGYMALYTSPNQAVNSFGAAMSISEITCVAAAVIALPAALVLVDRRR